MTMADANTQGPTRQLLAGRYRLTQVVRQGDDQTAWQAEDTELGRLVTVTELGDDKRHSERTARRRLVTRMLREAEVMALVCPGRVLTVLDIVEEDGRLWTVTETAEATPLDRILATEGTLDAVRAARIGLELLAVLTAAHREGITHGDVRPSYVLVRPDGQVVLNGFGVTAAQSAAPSYASPERARGERPGPSSDLWSLGAVLYAMVEGRPPFRDLETPAATLAAVLNEPVVPPRHAGPLALAINGLLRKDPLERTDDPVVRKVLNRIIGEARFGTDATDLLGLRLGFGLGFVEQNGAAPETAPTRPPARATAPRRRAVSMWRRPLWRMTVRDRTVSWTPAGLTVAAVSLLVAFTTVVTVVMLDDRSPAASALPSPAPSASTGRSSSAPSASSTGERTVVIPKDYSLRHDPEGFTIALPDTFGRIGDNGHGSGSLFGAFDDPRSVLVDWTHSPGADPVVAWQSLEKKVRASITDYHRVGTIESLDYRGWKAADWEWTSTVNGVRYRTLNRGFVVDSRHGYAIKWSVPESVWYAEANQQALHLFLDSFQPAR
ncbi:MAG: hypothetical protein QOF84_6364 [Streptomyces sp.]|nr:hypothetical protein [Streptomyces sp.]MDX6351574.1 hypothetical protein [Streptomyces sp.]